MHLEYGFSVAGCTSLITCRVKFVWASPPVDIQSTLKRVYGGCHYYIFTLVNIFLR